MGEMRNAYTNSSENLKGRDNLADVGKNGGGVILHYIGRKEISCEDMG
jgi:hypothetical protein